MVLVAIATLMLLPVLYLASLGPAIWLAERGFISTDQNSAAAIAYHPLEIACENCELLAQGIEFYASLWES